MMTVSIENNREVAADLSNIQRGATRAAFRALNKAAASGRAAMVKDIAGDLNIKARDARDAMPIREATPSRLAAEFGARLKRIPLYDFRARQTRRGVTYNLGGKGRSRVSNAFLAKMKSGHVGVFARAGKKRKPIVELFGPSLGHVFAKYQQAGLERTREAFEAYFAHEMKRITDKQAGA